MSLPTIAIINFSTKSDQEVQDAIRAVNRQVQEDFMPIWGGGRILKLRASPFDPADPETLTTDPVEADSVIYLVDEASVEGALGYHDMNAREIPVGFVFVLAGDWTVTLSHEVLELIIDPTVNIFVPGPDPRHPGDPTWWLWHSYEVCDAVERTVYEIDEVAVSNFVTPAYFREGDAPGTRNDFLGVGVESFGVIEDSHLGVFDPNTGEWVVIWGRMAPTLRACARRARAFDHKKPARPPDQHLCDVLDKYNHCPPKGCRGLGELRGITRTSRYMAAAERMSRQARAPRPARAPADPQHSTSASG